MSDEYTTGEEQPTSDDPADSKARKDKMSKVMLEEVQRAQEQQDKNNQTGKQLGLGVPDEEDTSFEDLFGDDAEAGFQDPSEAHSLYYAIQGLMRDHLPEGEAAKGLREFVYNEKNIFLTRGHDLDANGVRGADSRQGYLTDLRIVLQEVKQWARLDGSAVALWDRFRAMNEKAGYYDDDKHHASPDDSEAS